MMRECVSKIERERTEERERKGARGVAVAWCSKKKKSQKSNKLTILLSSVDALIKGK